MESGFTPAAHHAIGYGPVEASAVLGSTALVILGLSLTVLTLKKRAQDHPILSSDEMLVIIGCIFWIIGGFSMYYCWIDNAQNSWYFILPVWVTIGGFPFTSSNRAIYTRAIQATPILRSKKGTMQSLISVLASVPGFM